MRRPPRARPLVLGLLLVAAASLARPSAAFAPDKPRNLVVDSVGSRFVELDWRRVSRAEHYNVYRDGNLVAQSTRSSYRDEGLEPATTYEYRVSAVDEDGDEGPLSDSVQATTDPLPPPAAPRDLTATAVGSGSIDLTWSASDSEVGIDYYRILRDGDEVATTDSTGFTDTGLEPETRYQYRVSAVDGAGRESDPSDPASATTLSEPGPPPPADLEATAIGPAQIDLEWNPPVGALRPVEGYRVYRDGKPLGTVVATAFADTGLSPDTEYEYAVSSVDDRGIEGELSAGVSATTDPPADIIPPAAPTGLRLAGQG